MDGPTLQNRIFAGYAQVAQRIGSSFDHYRPTAACAPKPLDPANKIGSLSAHFRVDDQLANYNKYGNALWKSWHDGRLTAPGDYLVAAAGTWFIAAQQSLLPPLCIQCNRVVSLRRFSMTNSLGALPYAGDVAANEILLMDGWPASILQGGGGGGRSEVGLPEDAGRPGWQVLLPAWPGLLLLNSDSMTDDLGNRYILSSVELTDLGWRVSAQQAVT